MRDPHECLDDVCRLCVHALCRALAAGRRGQDHVRATRRRPPRGRSRVPVAGDAGRCRGAPPARVHATIGHRSTRRPARPPPRPRADGTRREHRRRRSPRARDASARRATSARRCLRSSSAGILAPRWPGASARGPGRDSSSAGCRWSRIFPSPSRVARDGTVWFTIDVLECDRAIEGRPHRKGAQADARTSSRSASPLTPTGPPGTRTRDLRAISQVSNDGTITSFDLATPVARLGRLAIAPDGAVWFAEPTAVSVTRLQGWAVHAAHRGSARRGGRGQCRAVWDRRRRAGHGLGDASRVPTSSCASPLAGR